MSSPHDTIIRREEPEDISSIYALNVLAFNQAAEARLIDKLRKNYSIYLSLVATIQEKVVGHIFFTPVTIDTISCNAMGLAPMAVHPEWQRKGIGSKLVQAGIAILKERGYDLIAVLGDPAFYGRFGFKTASHLGIICEYENIDDSAFMVLMFGHLPLSGKRALLRYCPEFQEEGV